MTQTITPKSGDVLLIQNDGGTRELVAFIDHAGPIMRGRTFAKHKDGTYDYWNWRVHSRLMSAPSWIYHPNPDQALADLTAAQLLGKVPLNLPTD